MIVENLSVPLMRSIQLLSVLMLPLTFVAGCTSSGVNALSSSGQPRLADYTCSGGRSLQVINTGSTVTINGLGADSVTLPASPPGQRNRYSADLYTIVLDGRSAFYHKTGDTPRDCKR